MERSVYLVRHGKPDLGSVQGKVYLGRKDVPLQETGREHCRLLGYYFRRKNIETLVSSPLLRCRQTAEALLEGMKSSETLQTAEALQEVDTGLWDGRSFDEIRALYPEEYEERGRHPGRCRFPEGESLEQAGQRFAAGLERLLDQTEGHLLAVTHGGVIRAFLCRIAGEDPDQLLRYRIPYGSVTEVIRTDRGWKMGAVGFYPTETMTEEKAEAFWEECGTTEEQRAHMKKTAEFALSCIGYTPEPAGGPRFDPAYVWKDTVLHTGVIYYGCLLHDLLRSAGRGHEQLGGEWMQKKGYRELAEVISLHNDPEVLREGRPLSESELVFYADKRVKGTRIVTVSDRFSLSRSRLHSPEAERMFEERLDAARKIEQKLLSFSVSNY